jgi:hypothetical protein
MPTQGVNVMLTTSQGRVVAVVVANNPRAALIEAINLLAMQTVLPPGWTLRAEEGEPKD